MTSLTKLMITVGVALSCPAAMAPAQTTSLPIFTGGLTEPAARAVHFIISRAEDTKGTPLRFAEEKVPFTNFRANLKESVTGLYVSTLSTYRRCYPEARALGAFDFPFLAKDWAGARQILNGATGLAAAEGFQELGIQVMNFWDGETRVISSNAPISSPRDLKGKKVLSAPTFASATVIEQNGGVQVKLPGGEAAAALGRGLVDAADVSLGFYTRGLTDVQKSVLLSNHSFDPIVVTVPVKTLKSLEAIQRGFLESVIRQATEYQIREARSAQDRNLAALKERGVNVVALSDSAGLSFRTVGLSKASLENAKSVFAGTSQELKTAGASQAQGQPIAPYWKVFFATNRAAADQQFTKDMGPGLLYGHAEVEFDFDEPVNTPAELIGMLRYAVKGAGVLINWNSVSDAPFPEGFAKAPRVVPAKAPLIYVHGFANSFEDALRRAAWIGWNAKRPVVALAWPSRGTPTLGAYRDDQQTADQSLNTLALVLERLGLDYDTVTDVDIVVHSMGARVLLGALETLAQKNYPAKPPRFRQLVLVAPDIATAKLHQGWAALGKYFDRKATLYVSDHDKALGISRSLMNPAEGDRAGLAPPVLVEDEIESIFIGPNDFSFVGHSYHVANGIIADDIFEVLRYGTGAQDRRGSGPSPGGQGYYELYRLKNP